MLYKDKPIFLGRLLGLCLTHLKCILMIGLDQHLWHGGHWNWGRDISRHARSPKIGAHKFVGLSNQGTPPPLPETPKMYTHFWKPLTHNRVFVYMVWACLICNILISKRQYPYTVTGKSLAHFFFDFFGEPPGGGGQMVMITCLLSEFMQIS